MSGWLLFLIVPLVFVLGFVVGSADTHDRRWNRWIGLSSGRELRIFWRPFSAAVSVGHTPITDSRFFLGTLEVAGTLNEGETEELKALMANDQLIRKD